MSTVVVLDAGPLGHVTNSNVSPEAFRGNAWLGTLLETGIRVVVPEIADYEVRRELLRVGRGRGLARLDALKSRAEYVPLTTEIMLQAAEFWAFARKQGRPTADPHAFDGDVILAAQAAIITHGGDQAIIATTNVGHLGPFADARLWHEIA